MALIGSNVVDGTTFVSLSRWACSNEMGSCFASRFFIDKDMIDCADCNPWIDQS
jgi:hypothetical protein